MRVLVVDDEKLARERLLNMLQQIPEYEPSGGAANGIEALRLLEKERSDIVLMDIRMPGMDGIEAARHITEMDQPPAVIFTTAYGEHALEAFETNAVGYLLKPIRIDKMREALASAHKVNRAQLANLQKTEKSSARTHICARVRGNLELIPIENIVYFHADQKYVTIRHRDGEVLIEEALKALEEEFEPRFLRIHRNALVAKTYLAGMEKTKGGRFQVILKSIDDRLEISRRHVAEARRFMRSL